MDPDKRPIVSVCMITFNHETYIREAIEGVLMQQCNFTIELIIGDDYSTDKTKQICQEYASKNSVINLLPSESNLGMMANFIRTLKGCTGKYIALCEGDDYWTDPYKLQKQVNFLEESEDFAICFHDTFEQNNDNPYCNFYYCSNLKNSVFEFKDLLHSNFIPTCSAVFRNEKNIIDLPKWVYKSPAGDWILHLLNATRGRIKFINEVMGVHRIHSTGIWSKNSQIENLKSIVFIYTLVYKNLNEIKYFKHDYKKGKSNIYKLLDNEFLNNRKYLKSIFYGLKYLIMDPDLSIFNLKSILKLFYYSAKKNISGNRPMKSNKIIEHIDVGLSIIQSTNFVFRNPVKDKKYVKIGNNCLLNCNFVFESEGGEVFLGDNVFIGKSDIICRNKISFGNNIFVESGCCIIDHDSHSIDFNERRKHLLQHLNDFRTGQSNFTYDINEDKVNSAPVIINDNVWLGMNVTILKGVTLGEGVIVGPGSVVTDDVPPWTIVEGNPAKVVKELPSELRKQ